MHYPALSLPVQIDGRRPNPETLVTETGRLGGPSYLHRGAMIDCHSGGHVCQPRMEGHPLDRTTFGEPRTIVYMVDLWIDHHCLTPWLRATKPRIERLGAPRHPQAKSERHRVPRAHFGAAL